jgi:hypothetical protein
MNSSTIELASRSWYISTSSGFWLSWSNKKRTSGDASSRAPAAILRACEGLSQARGPRPRTSWRAGCARDGSASATSERVSKSAPAVMQTAAAQRAITFRSCVASSSTLRARQHSAVQRTAARRGAAGYLSGLSRWACACL